MRKYSGSFAINLSLSIFLVNTFNFPGAIFYYVVKAVGIIGDPEYKEISKQITLLLFVFDISLLEVNSIEIHRNI
ncbi:MAG: hypothetical protein ACYSTS_09320 [Planctomycetota bacterium]